MRFLRMRPAVCAMISCSFSSFTRKVALGSSSVTTPGNSSTSSLAILSPETALTRHSAMSGLDLAGTYTASAADCEQRYGVERWEVPEPTTDVADPSPSAARARRAQALLPSPTRGEGGVPLRP